MKKLDWREEKILFEYGITPTVIQCDEWESRGIGHPDYDKMASDFGCTYDEAISIYEKYDEKVCCVEDSISLDDLAVWYLYKKHTKEELESLSASKALTELKDFKYFFGFRKFEERDMYPYIADAIRVHDGECRFATYPDGELMLEHIED